MKRKVVDDRLKKMVTEEDVDPATAQIVTMQLFWEAATGKKCHSKEGDL